MRKSRPLALLAGILVGACGWMAGCVQPAHEEGHPHWGYEGGAGPPAWGTLSGGYRTCSVGQHQSPVNIEPSHAEPAHVPTLAVHYRSTPSTEVNNGHTIEDDVPPGDFVELGSARFDLEQFHFHHPSEHTLDGVHFPLEIHFVHKSDSGERLVVAVFVTEGPEHPTLHTLFDHLPHDHEAIHLYADPVALLPGDRRFVEYEGSLTTPPCNEGVTWLVMTTPITASGDQLREFAAMFPHNNRPLMPLNGRHLLAGPGS